MDSNNPPVQPNIQPAPAPTPTAPEASGSNKMILWFVIGLVVVIAAVGGIYLFLSKQQAIEPKSQTTQTSKTQTPIPTPAENLETDLNSIDVDTETDLSEIDKDLQAL